MLWVFQFWSNQVTGVPGRNVPKHVAKGSCTDINTVTDVFAEKREPRATTFPAMVSVMPNATYNLPIIELLYFYAGVFRTDGLGIGGHICRRKADPASCISRSVTM